MENLGGRILQANSNRVIDGFNFECDSRGIYAPVHVIKSNGENIDRKVPLLITYECHIQIDDAFECPIQIEDEEDYPDKDLKIPLIEYSLRRYDSNNELKIDFLGCEGIYDFGNIRIDTLILIPNPIKEELLETAVIELREHMEKIKASTTEDFPDYLIV